MVYALAFGQAWCFADRLVSYRERGSQRDRGREREREREREIEREKEREKFKVWYIVPAHR